MPSRRFVYDGRLRAVFLKLLGDAFADAVRPAGNDHDFILEHVYIPPSVILTDSISYFWRMW